MFSTRIYLLACVGWLAAASASEWAEQCTTPNQRRGVCVSVLNCESLNDLVKKSVSSQQRNAAFSLLRMSQCGFQDSYPLVCCPLDTRYLSVVTQLPPPPPPPPTLQASPASAAEAAIPSVEDVTHHPKRHLVNTHSCGRGSQDKIFYGNATGLNEFPWMVALKYQGREQRQLAVRCDGTLINDRYVLTAAHCLAPPLKLVSAVVGAHDLNQGVECEVTDDGRVCNPPHLDVRVEQTHVHPMYDPADAISHLYDIGLVRLASRVDITQDSVQPICLPMSSEQHMDLRGKRLIVTGWGLTEKGSRSNVLLQVSLPVVDLRTCSDDYKQHFVFSPRMCPTITERQICAGGEASHADSCNGDSGGPMQTFSLVAGEPRFVQYGIVSYGSTACGTVNLPGVYTNIEYYRKWLLDTIQP